MATTYARIQLLSKPAAQFVQNNPVLLDGELGIQDSGSNTPIVKIGDGVRPWSALPPVGGTPSVGPGFTWTPAGNYNISAPATGSTLALQGNAGGPALDVSGGAGNTDPADTVVRFTQTSGPGALLTLRTQSAIGSTVIAASPTGYAPGAAPCAFALFTEPTVPSIILQAFGAAATMHIGGTLGVVIDPPLTSGPALSISNLATDKALVISGSVANTGLVKFTGTAGQQCAVLVRNRLPEWREPVRWSLEMRRGACRGFSPCTRRTIRSFWVCIHRVIMRRCISRRS